MSDGMIHSNGGPFRRYSHVSGQPALTCDGAFFNVLTPGHDNHVWQGTWPGYERCALCGMDRAMPAWATPYSAPSKQKQRHRAIAGLVPPGKPG